MGWIHKLSMNQVQVSPQTQVGAEQARLQVTGWDLWLGVEAM